MNFRLLTERPSYVGGSRQQEDEAQMRHTIAFATILMALAAAAPAEAKQHWRYKSRHPHHHGGFCGNDRPHVHDYAPADARVYRVVDGEYYFVGDPVAFGYEGPRYAYYGAHPVAEMSVHFGEPVHCYLEGPHYHWYQPPPQTQFALRGGAFWFMGTFDPAFHTHHRRYAVVNEVHRPIRYGRPTVAVVDAPSGWRGGPRGLGHVVVAPPARGPAPVVVRERVQVVHVPPGHHKHHGDKHHGDRHRGRGHDRDDDRDRHDRGKHKGGKHDGHGKGKWRD